MGWSSCGIFYLFLFCFSHSVVAFQCGLMALAVLVLCDGSTSGCFEGFGGVWIM
jgi:hypothetical protein